MLRNSYQQNGVFFSHWQHVARKLEDGLFFLEVNRFRKRLQREGMIVQEARDLVICYPNTMIQFFRTWVEAIDYAL